MYLYSMFFNSVDTVVVELYVRNIIAPNGFHCKTRPNNPVLASGIKMVTEHSGKQDYERPKSVPICN